jgi:hypothetical protein
VVGTSSQHHVSMHKHLLLVGVIDICMLFVVMICVASFTSSLLVLFFILLNYLVLVPGTTTKYLVVGGADCSPGEVLSQGLYFESTVFKDLVESLKN